ncbi:MAG: hypothetical protein ACXVIY_06200 [Mucilaginibacter sp.]
MKAILLSIILAFVILSAKAGSEATATKFRGSHNTKAPVHFSDSVKMIVDTGTMAYYQKMVKVDSNIKISTIYTRTLEFMAAKNFQQTYGYEQEGKLIFTTSQELNTNPEYGGDNDDPQSYSVQFSIMVDMHNGRYRYTISNIIFYLGSQSGNRRMPLYDLYLKETSGESRRIEKNAKKIVDSFEKYLVALTTELHTEIQHKGVIYNPRF